MDVSDDWGTAVIIQAMVYGNLSHQAGSGVLFTAHPYRKVRRVALWGDYAPGDQGEDIVSGLVTSYPISVEQAELDGRSVEEFPGTKVSRQFMNVCSPFHVIWCTPRNGIPRRSSLPLKVRTRNSSISSRPGT